MNSIITGVACVIIGLTLIIQHKFFGAKIFEIQRRGVISTQQRIEGFFPLSLIVGTLFIFLGGLSIYGFSFFIKDIIGLVGGIGVCIVGVVWFIVGIRVWSETVSKSYQEKSIAHLVNRIFPILYLIAGMGALLAGGLFLRLAMMQGLSRIYIFLLGGGIPLIALVTGIISIFISCRAIIKRFDYYHYFLEQKQFPKRGIQIAILLIGIGFVSLGILFCWFRL